MQRPPLSAELAFSVAHHSSELLESVQRMTDQSNPGPGRSTADAAFSKITKEIARRNEETHLAARKLRAARDKEKLKLRRQWDRQ